jgi:hypothetical protein
MLNNVFLRGIGVGVISVISVLYIATPTKNIDIIIPIGFQGEVYRQTLAYSWIAKSPTLNVVSKSHNDRVLKTGFNRVLLSDGRVGVEVMVLIKKGEILQSI